MKKKFKYLMKKIHPNLTFIYCNNNYTRSCKIKGNKYEKNVMIKQYINCWNNYYNKIHFNNRYICFCYVIMLSLKNFLFIIIKIIVILKLLQICVRKREREKKREREREREREVDNMDKSLQFKLYLFKLTLIF